jgi:hypothetical protein
MEKEMDIERLIDVVTMPPRRGTPTPISAYGWNVKLLKHQLFSHRKRFFLLIDYFMES